jgi:transposase
VAVQQLPREIRELGYQGSSNLLVRYVNQGRPDGSQPHLSPRQAARLLLTRPGRLTGGQAETLSRIEAACPEMTALASLIRGFAALFAPDPGNAARLQEWITTARAAGLPHAHALTRGLDLDIQAATAALTLPFHNGRTEGVNTVSVTWNHCGVSLRADVVAHGSFTCRDGCGHGCDVGGQVAGSGPA